MPRRGRPYGEHPPRAYVDDLRDLRGLVTGGVLGDDLAPSFTISVTAVNNPPTLNPAGEHDGERGATADQTITGNGSGRERLTFSKDVGPAYLTVDTTATTGNIHLAPGFSDAGRRPRRSARRNTAWSASTEKR